MDKKKQHVELPEGFTIRPMVSADLPFVYDIELATSLRPWADTIFLDCLRVGYHCLVLCSPMDSIVGFAVVRIKAGEAHLFNIAIQSDYQGQGLGYDLMRHIIAAASGLEAKEMMLEVRQSNVSAIHLYEKMGFIQVGRRENYYPGNPPEDAILYTLHMA